MILVLQTVSIGIFVFFVIYAVATLTLLAMSVHEISWYCAAGDPIADDRNNWRVDRASAS